MVAAIARDVGFDEISLSHEVSPLMKLVARGDTCLADAYLNPVLGNYLAELRSLLPGSDIRVLTSAGSLSRPATFRGKDSVLSGPAGGVVGFSRAAAMAGWSRAIGFDMGGTSTDVSRHDGSAELTLENEKAGVRIVTPMLAIETVAAGGGSICGFDGVQLHVGPASAGAQPGPACYGSGGPLTVTDLNVLLGRIVPEHFPFQLEGAAAQQRLDALRSEVSRATGRAYAALELADGFLRIANSNMIKAIRAISVAQGVDPREYLLVAFGGAAPQHACAIATELGMSRVLVPENASVLSAYGVGMADVVRHLVHGVYKPLADQLVTELDERVTELSRQVREQVVAEGVPHHAIALSIAFDLRYVGMDASLRVPTANGRRPGILRESFQRLHQERYGYVHENRDLELVAVHVEAVGRVAPPIAPAQYLEARPVTSDQQRDVYFDGHLQQTSVHTRGDLAPGDRITGPALIADSLTTIVVQPAWHADVLSDGQLLLSHAVRDSNEPALAGKPEDPAVADPITLELFNHQFGGIAQRMGATLQNTASSVNVKERLDFSCALFTATGDLVVNAPHIPVHLGAMSETVKRVLLDQPVISPGDCYITNDPYRGGSHLPDVTVITPVHDDRTGKLLFFTASRAHHAEIGGIVPGSMPPFSTNLAQEGVLIRSMKLIEAGRSRLDRLADLLGSGPYPSRNVHDNLSDVSAQIAANQCGADALRQMVQRYSAERVVAYMAHIQAAAERKMRKAIAALPDGRHTFSDHLDNGARICAAIEVTGEQCVIDFSGTSPVQEGNLNANRAIVNAAVMYSLRCLIDEPLPMNQGMLAPIHIILPTCLLNPPEQATPAECAAVVGGNVETSQRVVDVLLGALGLAAASQGTMNNLLFGDETFGYYETICGGAGATPHADGADAVHTHMTNTRITDPEVLEQRYGVRVLEFSIRQQSGGNGRYRGGNGVIRRLQFTRTLEVSIVSQRRGPYPPYGLAGGAPGRIGVNWIRRSNGQVERLPGSTRLRVNAGDILTIETPGGGGFGEPKSP
jgi:5-oxoprolinase (ATP-hydrolysing)